jgi:hypothetical protein
LIIRGYVVNTLEGVGANGSLVMVWQLAPANVNDITLFEQYLNSLPDIPREKGLKKLSVDAAYYSDKIAVLAEKKGLLLLPSDLTGKDIEPLWADFQLNEEGTRVIGCPNDNEILECLPLTKQGRMTVHLNLDGCEGCPHRDICKVREVKGANGKKVASVSVSPKSICRARIQEQLGTDAYQPYQHLRNGVETIQSILKNVYGLTRMLYKGLVKNKIHLACAIGALNFRKYLGFLNDTGRYAENPLLW